MITTRRPRSASEVHPLLAGVLLLLGWLAALGWALEVLLPRSITAPLVVGASAGLAGLGWRTARTAVMRRQGRTARWALAEHRDPGPEARAVVDERARELLARPAADLWFPAWLGVVLAVACGVLAVVRGVGTAALPVLPLLALTGSHVAFIRRRLLQASRWLDDPPYEREEQARPPEAGPGEDR